MRPLRWKLESLAPHNITPSVQRRQVAMERVNRASMMKPQKDAYVLDSESSSDDDDLEKRLLTAVDDYNSDKSESNESSSSTTSVLTRLGLLALLLLTLHNCFSMLLIRFVMKNQPNFLASAAVLVSELIKLAGSCSYILFIQKKSIGSIAKFLKEDRKNTMLLVVPACAYNFQMSMAYVALANIDAALYSVICQSRLLFTAVCAVIFLRKKLKYIQLLSLILLTCGVMLCNMADQRDSKDDPNGSTSSVTLGISAALGISFSSGIASVYTERVIKGNKNKNISEQEYGLAYTQVQLALMSIFTMGTYAFIQDWDVIKTNGLFHNFSSWAALSVVNNAVGGLIVASVLKYADSVLKGYATALAATLTGILSYFMFGTALNSIYFMGIINVLVAVILYNGNDDLHRLMC
ncbi:solute carrier family 35 (UDP-sugar transporter), member A1/2/3 [Fistulifera solaris]|uniref:Solute carrier family 35 (UDP-sugar transporter), member A1/2/3 n=1 Tax=Fistulifera solaris TaxID=1519565 RepID=A0A1Z5KAB3_FISSO|nr:solute carrier family 35 (UDP-sugar transporter), member A1/2/3 [Fistulifera solaris]|eukprot:GAX22878.1 solute carrier family 35 (UDP-sugar transporter), member A1/2/3 [Fistulifera solaris]